MSASENESPPQPESPSEPPSPPDAPPAHEPAPQAPRATGTSDLLRLGSKGPNVAELQRQLVEAGFSPGAVNGVFGHETEVAVSAFQHARGLVVDGIAGPKVHQALARGTQRPEGPAEKGISQQQLQEIMPKLSAAHAAEFLPYLNAAMSEASIDTPLREAAFLAQLAHESGELRFFVEFASGAEYEGRKDLGNIHPGDGPRYKGRGPIQLTGRTNYRLAGQALGIDLENNPTRAADVDVAFRVSGWFWNSRGLNALADQDDFRGITHRINGGYNGLAQREAYYQRARSLLGV